MQNKIPQAAFILAAGKGTRLRPYTNNIPKPMVLINGKPIIGHIIEKLRTAGIKKIIINLFYKGNIIEDYVSQFKDVEIILSKENYLLDTGGGVKNAIENIKEEKFFLINGDAFWTGDCSKSVFHSLAESWGEDETDMLLLMQPIKNMHLTQGVGDYDINENSQAIRNLEKAGEYMFSGIRLVKKSIIEQYPENIFSFLKLMDQAQQQNKLYGHIFEGHWHHISTPQDLENVNESLNT